MMLFFFLIIVLVSSESRAAVTIDNTTSAEANVGTPNSIPNYTGHTIAADADAILIGVCMRDTNASGYTNDTATVTVGGVSATQILAVDNTVSIRLALFRLLAPTTGTPSIAVAGDTGTDRLIIGVMSLKGVAQSGSFNTASSNYGLGVTDADIDSLASATGEFAIMAGCIRLNTITPSADATSPVSTEQLDVAHTDSTSVRVFLYTEDGASSAINMRVDLSGSGDWAGVAVSVRPESDTSFGPLRRRYE